MPAIIVTMNTYLVYDSGTGGAWFSLQLLALRKATHVIFYADTAHFPLGLKNETALYGILRDFFTFSSPLKVDGIFLACNTISSVYLRYWPLFKKNMETSIPIFHTYSYHEGLPKLQKPLILATQSTVDARIYTYFTGGKGVEVSATKLIDAVQRNNSELAQALVHNICEYAKKEHFSDIVLGCTHLSEVAGLFAEEGFRTYDPLGRILENLTAESPSDGGDLSLTLHATGSYDDVLNYVRRKASFLPEEVLLNADR